MSLPPWVREVLRCPACHGELTDRSTPEGEALVCAGCAASYPVVDGVPVLLVEPD